MPAAVDCESTKRDVSADLFEFPHLSGWDRLRSRSQHVEVEDVSEIGTVLAARHQRDRVARTEALDVSSSPTRWAPGDGGALLAYTWLLAAGELNLVRNVER